MPSSSTLVATTIVASIFLLVSMLVIPTSADTGNPIGQDEYLWLVAIGAVASNGKDPSFRVFCSGALVSSRHVLTSHECLDGHSMKDLAVRVGYFCVAADNCGRTFRTVGITEHRRNPQRGGDLAILLLDTFVSSKAIAPSTVDVRVEPTYLSRLQKKQELQLVSAGTSPAERLSMRLQSTNFKKCRKVVRSNDLVKGLVSKFSICSRPKKDCQGGGDPGSALVDVKNNLVIAIHTFGPPTCTSSGTAPLSWGHVATSAASDFIVSVVCLDGNINTDELPEWCPSPPDVCTAEVCAPLCTAMPPSSCPSPPSSSPPNSLRATLRHDFTNHRNIASSVSFDAASSLLASTGYDPAVFVWDFVQGGPPLHSLQLRTCCPQSVALRPDGEVLAVDLGFQVGLFDLTNTNNTRDLLGHMDFVDAVAWHPDGRQLVSGSADDTVKYWLVEDEMLETTGKVMLRHTFVGHSGNVNAVAFDVSGKTSHIASASTDGTVNVWNYATLALLRTLQGHLGPVWSVAYSPDGERLASGSWDDTIRIWNANNGALLTVLQEDADVYSVAWSPDSRWIVSGCRNGRMRIWDVAAATVIVETNEHDGRTVRSVAWSPNGQWMASASEDTTVKVWEITTTDDETNGSDN